MSGAARVQECLYALPTPCYVIDYARLEANCRVLAAVMQHTGCKILLAQKAFAAYALYPLLARYLSGVTASGLFEARLGREEFGKENHIFAPAYKTEQFDEIVALCDHIVFNSLTQFYQYRERCRGRELGLRINPQCSTQVGHAIYDPCAPGSRLGITAEKLRGADLEGVAGLHFHTLCEQNADALAVTLAAVEANFGAYLPQMRWLNFGGGHHITRADYDLVLLERCIDHVQEKYGVQVYLEPGEAVALNAGYLVTQVLDFVENDGIVTAVLDASAACHMPDVLEMPYRPPLRGAQAAGRAAYTYRLASCTCLAGDIIGDYSFDAPLHSGDKLIFEDLAIYSMVKNNTFNGMPLPSIYILQDGSCRLQKAFDYADFKGRLS